MTRTTLIFFSTLLAISLAAPDLQCSQAVGIAASVCVQGGNTCSPDCQSAITATYGVCPGKNFTLEVSQFGISIIDSPFLGVASVVGAANLVFARTGASGMLQCELCPAPACTANLCSIAFGRLLSHLQPGGLCTSTFGNNGTFCTTLCQDTIDATVEACELTNPTTSQHCFFSDLGSRALPFLCTAESLLATFPDTAACAVPLQEENQASCITGCPENGVNVCDILGIPVSDSCCTHVTNFNIAASQLLGCPPINNVAGNAVCTAVTTIYNYETAGSACSAADACVFSNLVLDSTLVDLCPVRNTGMCARNIVNERLEACGIGIDSSTNPASSLVSLFSLIIPSLIATKLIQA